MVAAAKVPEVFARKASGLVRVMSPYSAFIYNILTMGLIFPWTYLWAPGSLPGGHLVWGIILATIIEIPIAMAYVWLSTAFPRSGGDYVFQSRVFGGGVSFAVVMSGFVIWVLQWVALSGWLLAYLGFTPLFLGLGATLHKPGLIAAGLWCTTPNGIVLISIVNAIAALLLLVRGFRHYVRVQYYMFFAVIIAFVVMLGTLFSVTPTSFAARLNEFVAASGGVSDFYGQAIAAAKKAGIDLHPPFSLWATLLVAPIAWTSLQWAPYSSLQNGEIKAAKSFNSQMLIIVGSLVLTGALLAVLAYALQRAVGPEFMIIAGAGYAGTLPEGTLNGVYLWPNIIAMAVTQSPLVVIAIAVGYILNAFQIVNNCYIGMTRIIMAAAMDRLLPEWLGRVSPRLHTPVNAHVAYFIASLPVIFLYNFWPQWASLTLGVTFACGYVFVVTALAAALLPFRAPAIYKASPGARFQIGGFPLVTLVAGGGTLVGTVMILMFVFSSAFGLNTPLAREVVLGVLALTTVWYLAVKVLQRTRGIDVSFAFKEIPPE